MGMSWSAMRKVLEEEYICDALRGRVRYFVTRYRLIDDIGAVAIYVDGERLKWFRRAEFPNNYFTRYSTSIITRVLKKA